jgi:integrase
MPSAKRTVVGRIRCGKDPQTGRDRYHWVGRFATKRERDLAVARARLERPWEKPPVSEMTGNELADRYLAEYAERHKHSSTGTQTTRLKAFRREFGDRPVLLITRAEAKDWARTVYPGAMSPASAMFAWAIREEEVEGLERNPFRGMSGGFGKRAGRANHTPPTLEELDRIRDATAVLGDYGPQMRDLIDFAALTIMRPSELFELRFTDVDLRRNWICKSRRLYKGVVDTPKGGPATIALVPPAREILLRQPTRTFPVTDLVFVTQTGAQLCASTLSNYWQRVTARAGLDFDFYLATKHYGVSRLYRLGLSERAIAAQAGWSVRSVENMLDVYGHREQTLLSELQALYVPKCATQKHDLEGNACDAGCDAEPSEGRI